MKNNCTAIIVTFNNQEVIEKCLESVFQNNISTCIVVDNASDDSTVALIQHHFPHVTLIQNEHNVGFSKAVNQALALCDTDVLLINPDTLIAPDAVARMSLSIEEEKVAAVGPFTVFGNNSIQYSFGKFPAVFRILFDRLSSINTRWPVSVVTRVDSLYEEKKEVDWISGSCMLLSKEALKEVGEFDSGIFMYGEDVDWCYRAHNSGFKIMFEPTAKVTHYLDGNKSSRYPTKYVNNRLGFLYFFNKYGFLLQEYCYRVVLLIESLLRLSISLHRPVWRTAYLKTIRLAIGHISH